MTTERATKKPVLTEEQREERRRLDGRRKFERDDVFQTWRVVANNPSFSGETEGFGFSNGVAVIPGLPRTARQERQDERYLRLTSLSSYHFSETHLDRQGLPYLKVRWSYQIMDDAEYAKYAHEDDDEPDSDALPEDL